MEKIASALRQGSAAPEQPGIEITETVAMLNREASTRILCELKSMGTHIAIDDFVTVHSSLSHFKRIPADEVKINKSFVDGIDLEVCDTAIVHAILALADVMDKSVVAEGVETEDQYNALRSLNCHYVQGYWISRPLPPEEITLLLERRALTCAA